MDEYVLSTPGRKRVFRFRTLCWRGGFRSGRGAIYARNADGKYFLVCRQDRFERRGLR